MPVKLVNCRLPIHPRWRNGLEKLDGAFQSIRPDHDHSTVGALAPHCVEMESVKEQNCPKDVEKDNSVWAKAWLLQHCPPPHRSAVAVVEAPGQRSPSQLFLGVQPHR